MTVRPTLHPLTRTLLLVAVANGLAVNVALAVAGYDTTLHGVAGFLLGHGHSDSWEPMRQALAFLRSGQPGRLYQVVFFERGIIFTYPPASLLFLELIGAVTGQALASDAVLNAVSWVATAATAVMAARLLQESTGRYLPDVVDRVDRVLEPLLGAGLALAFYPIVRAFALGQIQTVVTCLVAGSMLAWTRERDSIAGLCCGVACVIKPQIGLLALWALLRGHRGFVRGWALAAGPLVAVSVWRYGLANQWDYAAQLSFITRHSWSYYPNQSVNGILNRALFIGHNLQWDTHYVPFNVWVYAGTLVSSALLVAGALFWRWQQPRPGDLAPYALAALSFTMASPVAWEHHYGVMLPVFAWFAPVVVAEARAGYRRNGVWLLAAYALSSNLLLPVNVLAPTRWNVVQAYLFAGAAVLLVFLYRRVASNAGEPGARPFAG